MGPERRYHHTRPIPTNYKKPDGRFAQQRVVEVVIDGISGERSLWFVGDIRGITGTNNGAD
jgi:hypothetical protein